MSDMRYSYLLVKFGCCFLVIIEELLEQSLLQACYCVHVKWITSQHTEPLMILEYQ